MRPRLWLAFMALSAALYWLTAARPLVAEPWQWADDGLFLLHGERFVQWIRHPAGPWLGVYDPILLAKPPAFGIWLAVVHLSRLPLRVAEFALLLLLPFLFRRAARPLADLTGWRFLLIMVLLVAVPSLPGELRLLRTGLQAFAGAGVLIAAVAIVIRAPGTARSQARWAALMGALFAVAYLNREESPWLIPAMAAALLVRETTAWRAGERRGILLPTLTGAVVAGALVGGVALLNWLHYGLLATSSRRGPDYVRLHETLTRLQPQHRERYVPISTRTRFRAYSLSPAFAQLRPYLEGPLGDEMARQVEYNTLLGRPPDAREFHATFGWALLRAADHAGARDAAAAERLFGAAANELQDAIRSGVIRSGVGGLQLMAAPMEGDGRRIAWSALRSAFLLFTVSGTAIPETSSSSGAPADVERMGRFARATVAPLDGGASGSPGESLRRRAWEVFVLGLRFVYPASFVALVACLAWAIVPQHRSPGVLAMAGAGLVLIGALVSFCLMIAVYDVLSLPTLQYPGGYNRLGFTPLSVLAAYAVVAGSFVVEKNREGKLTAP